MKNPQPYLFKEFEDPAWALVNEKGIDITDLPAPNYAAKTKGKGKQRRGEKTEMALSLKSYPKGKYFLFPTGGEHPSPLPKYQDRGKVFPFVFNTHTGKPVPIRLSRCPYPSMSFTMPEILRLSEGMYKDKRSIDWMSHILFGLAFVKNEDPSVYWTVDHDDEDKWNYELSNLKWESAERNQVKAARHLKGKTRKEAKDLGAGTDWPHPGTSSSTPIAPPEATEGTECDYTI
jgi:hypothetical protein